MKLRNVEFFNVNGMSRYAISRKSGLSYPYVTNVFGKGREVVEPSLFHIIRLLESMEFDWRELKLRDLVEVEAKDF